MPRPKSFTQPKYRGRPDGRAVVTLDGHDHYLGKYGSPESHDKYDELIAAWKASKRKVAAEANQLLAGPDVTVNEILAGYWIHAQEHYQEDGEPTTQLARVQAAIAPLRQLYGESRARDFGPIALQRVRTAFVEKGWCRTSVNAHTDCLRRAFRWAVAQQLLPGSVWEALHAVEPLKRGRTRAPERPPTKPVALEIVQATLPHLPAMLADVIRLQLLTAARAGEILRLTEQDLDRTGKVWRWSPAKHKTAWRGARKILLFGPAAQEILLRWMDGAETYLFSPAKAARLRRDGREHVRPSQQDRRGAVPRVFREKYTPARLGQAVHRACDRAGVARWRPHQLRHSAATFLRAEFGLEVAQQILGHHSVAMTEMYAEEDLRPAIEAMLKVG